MIDKILIQCKSTSPGHPKRGITLMAFKRSLDDQRWRPDYRGSRQRERASRRGDGMPDRGQTLVGDERPSSSTRASDATVREAYDLTCDICSPDRHVAIVEAAREGGHSFDKGSNHQFREDKLSAALTYAASVGMSTLDPVQVRAIIDRMAKA